ncbi:MAG: Fic family protein [Ignavibacteriae bacterium]|nr:Fic family protein [Ignavibacteriota bacterium]
MTNNKYFIEEISGFRGRDLPEAGSTVGYLALIKYYSLQVPMPDILCIISKRHYNNRGEEWYIFDEKYEPEDSLKGNLVFALKYEGIDLNVLKSLFREVSEEEITDIVKSEPLGKYTRKIWFLYEWLTEKVLQINDLKTGNFADLIDEKHQYPGATTKSSRHRINNNLSGVKDFCPIIRKTKKLESYIDENLGEKLRAEFSKDKTNLISRAVTYFLLKDTKASFDIEGETPPQSRISRWCSALGQAGKNEITKNELIRLQEIVLGDSRFTKFGYRTDGGFVGEHDRYNGNPIPDHISARAEDIEKLMNGFYETYRKLEKSDYDAVLMSAILSFGFVFIHPFADGNGRIHRFLINDILIKKGFTKYGYIFPISSVLLDRINEYRKILERYSKPRLEYIKWRVTPANNVEVLNDTIDLYRYYDATKQAEFLYECVKQTVEVTLPEEINYLRRYDAMKECINNRFDIPDKLTNLIIRFLEQNSGKFSERAMNKELKEFTAAELAEIEEEFFKRLSF